MNGNWFPPVYQALSQTITFGSDVINFCQEDKKNQQAILKRKFEEKATPKNVAIATLASTAVVAAAINPTTRSLLCGLLGISYSLSLIILQLMVLGLYLAMSGSSGLSSIANWAKECAKGALGTNGGIKGNGTGQIESKTPEPATPAQQEASVKKTEETSSSPQLNIQEERAFQEVWDETKGSPQNTSSPSFAELENTWKEQSTSPSQNPSVSASKTLGNPLQDLDELDSLAEEFIKDMDSESSQFSSSTNNLAKEFIETNPNPSKSGSSAENRGSGIVNGGTKSWAEEFIELTQEAPKPLGTVADLVREFNADQMAEEFLKNEMKPSTPRIIKPVMTAVGIGAVFCLGAKAIWDIYGAIKENDEQTEQWEEQEEIQNAYAGITKNTEENRDFEKKLGETIEKMWV